MILRYWRAVTLFKRNTAASYGSRRRSPADVGLGFGVGVGVNVAVAVAVGVSVAVAVAVGVTVAVGVSVAVGGELRSRKGLNLPRINLGISAFTDHDRKCLEFALGCDVDAISQSFVESGADIEKVRAAAAALGKKPFLIAKVERHESVKQNPDGSHGRPGRG